MDRKEAFTNHYKHNSFKGKESKSGPGSDPEQTLTLKKEIATLCKGLGVRNLLDFPCGDCFWMKDIWDELNLDMYIGMDIVEDLIIDNRNKYANEKRIFMWCDLVEAKSLPSADLMICRDCLVHLSLKSSITALQNLYNSNIDYILLTTFIDKNRQNIDSIDGTNWYPMNLLKPPFRLPPPILIINEGCTEGNGGYTDKCLGLWVKEDFKHLCGI